MHSTAFDWENSTAILDRVDLFHGRGNVYVLWLELDDVLVLLLQVRCTILQLLDLFPHQVCFPGSDSLNQCIVQEYVLLLGLNQEVSLSPDVTEEAEHVYDILLLDLL